MIFTQFDVNEELLHPKDQNRIILSLPKNNIFLRIFFPFLFNNLFQGDDISE